MTEWWSFQSSVLVNSIGGGVLGTGVGLLGAAAGVLAPRGVAKSFVIGAFLAVLTLGACTATAGIVAIAVGQPHHVWYPLLLIGALLSLITGGLLPVVAARYRQAEARKLEAEELRRA